MGEEKKGQKGEERGINDLEGETVRQKKGMVKGKSGEKEELYRDSGCDLEKGKGEKGSLPSDVEGTGEKSKLKEDGSDLGTGARQTD